MTRQELETLIEMTEKAVRSNDIEKNILKIKISSINRKLLEYDEKLSKYRRELEAIKV